MIQFWTNFDPFSDHFGTPKGSKISHFGDLEAPKVGLGAPDGPGTLKRNPLSMIALDFGVILTCVWVVFLEFLPRFDHTVCPEKKFFLLSITPENFEKKIIFTNNLDLRKSNYFSEINFQPFEKKIILAKNRDFSGKYNFSLEKQEQT